MSARPPTYVFGYGSLAALPELAPTRRPSAHGTIADLRGYRRGWGVAMDNRREVTGYKRYTDRFGRHPAVHVCFLDIEASDGSCVNGVCLPVHEHTLAALDARERNYERIDVTGQIDLGWPAERIWTYRGSPAGRERLRRGLVDGDAVIVADYLRAVRIAFARLGSEETRRAAPSLDPGSVPVLDLTRHDV